MTDEEIEVLRRAEKVVVVQDNDDAGRQTGDTTECQRSLHAQQAHRSDGDRNDKSQNESNDKIGQV